MNTKSRVRTIVTTFVFAVMFLFANAEAARAQSTHIASVTNGTSNQVYEIMLISRDSANWSQSGYEITVRNTFYNGGGIVKAFVGYGYQDSGTVTILEAAGQNQPKIFLGSEVVVSGTIKYVPVNIQVPAWQYFSVEVKFGTTETTSITAASQVQFTGTSTTTGATGANHDGSVNFTGKVGIGTTSPGNRLVVTAPDNSNAQTLFRVERNDGLVALTAGFALDSTNSMFLGTATNHPLLFTTNNTEKMRIAGGGNVGIGTTSPVVRGGAASGLNISSASDSGVQVDSTATNGNVLFTGNSTGTGNMYLTNNASANLFLGTGSYVAQQLVINSSGNVGVGTTSPTRKLHTVGSVLFDSLTSDFMEMSSANGPYIRFQKAGVVQGYFGFANPIGMTGSPGTNDQGWFSNGKIFIEPSGGTISLSGNVGIGTTDPAGYRLNVNGTINSSSTITASNIVAKYQDVAEWVPSAEQLSAGTVVVLDSTKSNQVVSSSVSYDTRVAGVVSEQPGISLGEKSDSKVLVATTGRVRVKVDASKGAIHIGDLLVTSDIPGVAMKSEAVNLGGVQFHRPGTLIGKALEPLEKGKGEILVLLSLQ